MSLYACDAWLKSGGVEDAECVLWLLANAPGSVLDIGCSTGQAVAVFLGAGCEVTGVDIEEKALRLARERCPKGRFLLADAAALPFEDGSFSIVHMGCMRAPLQEKSKWGAACGEARRVLKQSGLLLLGDIGAAQELDGFALLRRRDATDALIRFAARWIWNNGEPFTACGAREYTLSVYEKR